MRLSPSGLMPGVEPAVPRCELGADWCVAVTGACSSAVCAAANVVAASAMQIASNEKRSRELWRITTPAILTLVKPAATIAEKHLDRLKVIPLNIQRDGALHGLDGNDQLVTALGDEDSFQPIEAAAYNTHAPSALQERILRPRHVVRLQPPQIAHLLIGDAADDSVERDRTSNTPRSSCRIARRSGVFSVARTKIVAGEDRRLDLLVAIAPAMASFGERHVGLVVLVLDLVTDAALEARSGL